MASRITREIFREAELDRRLGKSKKSENDRTRIQTLIFDKEFFPDPDDAIAWAKSNKFKGRGVDEKENTYRLRQRDPDDFLPSTFRTIELTEGVKAVVGHPFTD